MLPFEPDGRSPRCAVKVASSPATTTGTVREHERLVSLHASLSRHTARALPRPWDVLRGAPDGLRANMRCRPVDEHNRRPLGSPTESQARRSRCRGRLVHRVCRSNRSSTRRKPSGLDADLSPSRRRRAIVAVEFLEAAEQTAGSNPVGRSAVHQHYDAEPWNVHIDGAEPLLIDWETDDLRPSDCLGRRWPTSSTSSRTGTSS